MTRKTLLASNYTVILPLTICRLCIVDFDIARSSWHHIMVDKYARLTKKIYPLLTFRAYKSTMDECRSRLHSMFRITNGDTPPWASWFRSIHIWYYEESTVNTLLESAVSAWIGCSFCWQYRYARLSWQWTSVGDISGGGKMLRRISTGWLAGYYLYVWSCQMQQQQQQQQHGMSIQFSM